MDARALTPPPSLLAWIPHLWRHVLFPGPSSSAPDPPCLADLFWLILLPGVLLYPCLSFDLFEPDESRYAQVPREMLRRGDWVIPHLQAEPYLDKPPLFYWLVMFSYRFLGVSEAAARLVPALAVHATILLCYLMGRRWIGRRRGFWGAVALALSPAFLGMGRLLILDGILTLWTTLALFAGFEATRGEQLRWGWWVLASAACGLGLLTKGPVALLLLLPPLLLYRWLDGRGAKLGRLALLSLAVVVLLMNLPWYVAACLREPTFARHFLWEHNILRFVAPFDHPRGVWFYVPIVLLGLLPGTLLLVPFIRFLLSGRDETATRRSPELGFLLLAGCWCLVFFTLSGCKLPTYILPAFPPMCLAFGLFLARSRWAESRWPRAITAVAFVAFVAFQHVLLPWYAAHRSPVREAEVLRRYCAADESVVCYPRPCSAVAFFLDRDDLRSFRSKDIEELRTLVRMQPRTVILCTHRHSLEGLRQLLPPEVRIVDTFHFGLPAEIPGVPSHLASRLNHIMGRTALGLCDLAVVEMRR